MDEIYISLNNKINYATLKGVRKENIIIDAGIGFGKTKAHNMEIIENEDGESEIHYLEKQVGCFTAEDPWLKYDEKKDKTYVHAYAVIPESYTEAADIIRRKGGTKVSCELVINELSYNAKEKYLDLTDFYFGGCTLLGVDEQGNEIGEGMLGARADIADFCHKEPVYTYQDKLIETLNKLNITLESFSNTTKNSEQKGGNNMDKLNELLAQYGKATEDVTFEIEGLSDEELEAKFAEMFDDNSNSSSEDGIDTGDADGDQSNDGEGADNGDPEVPAEEKFVKTFTIELSHEDVRYALYNLIGTYEEEDNEWYSIRSVYDNYFYMQGWCTNKLYKVNYAVDGSSVSLTGDRQEMFEIIVSESEKLAIDKMREDYVALEAQYNELKAFKDDYDATELKSKKDAIFSRDEYAILVDDEAFKTLMSEAENYSVEEIETKADVIFAKFVKANGEYSANNETKKPRTVGFNYNAKPSKKKTAYGGLFDKDE